MNKFLRKISEFIHSNKEILLFISLQALLVIFFFKDTFLGGKVISSVDFLFLWEPWSSLVKGQFLPSNYVLSDPVGSFYPIQKYFYEHISQFEFPLWNNISGLGNSSGAHFLPNSVVNPFLFIPMFLSGFKEMFFAVNFYTLAPTIIRGIFTYLLLKKYKLSTPAAFVGGLINTFALYNIVWGITSLAYISSMLPVVLWASERMFENTNRKNLIIFTLSYMLLVLGGFLSTIGYITYFVGAYILSKSFYRWFMQIEDWKYIFKRLLMFFAGGIITAGILGFTLLPTYDYFVSSVDISYREKTHAGRFLSFDYLPRLVFPDYLGNPVEFTWQAPPFQPKNPTNYNESAIYIGIIPLIFIAFTIFDLKKPKLLFFFVFSALLTSIIFKIGPMLDFVRNFPIFSNNPSTRLLVLLSFTLIVLTAFGMDSLFKIIADKTSIKFRKLTLVILMILGIVALSLYRISLFTKGFMNFDLRISIEVGITIFFLLSGFILIYMLMRKFIPVKWAVVLILLLAFLDLYRVGNEYIPYVSKEMFYPRPGSVSYLKKDNNKYRVLAFDEIFLFAAPSYYGINTMTPVGYYSQRWVNVINHIQTGSIALKRETLRYRRASLNLDSQILDLMNVKYIVDHGDAGDLNKNVMYYVRDFNSEVELSNEDYVMQTFTAEKDIKLDGVGIRPQQIILSKGDNAKLTVEIIDLESDKTVSQVKISVQSMLSTDWNEFKFEESEILIKDKVYGLKISLDSSSKTTIKLWAVNKDLYSPGILSLNGEEILEDLTMYLYFEDKDISRKYSKVYDHEVKIYRNNEVIDRAFLVHKTLYAEDNVFDEFVKLEGEKKLGEVAIIESQVIPDAISLEACSTVSEDQVKITSYRANTIELKSKSKCDSVLVLTDLYHKGWNVYVDGDKSNVLLTDYLFRGVYIPAGSHNITFKYEPESFKTGLMVTGVTIVSLGVIFAIQAVGDSRKLGNKALKKAKQI